MSTLRELKARATELVEAIEKDDDELTKRIDKEVRAWLVGGGDQPDFEDCGQWDDIQAAHDEISDADYDTDFYRDEA